MPDHEKPLIILDPGHGYIGNNSAQPLFDPGAVRSYIDDSGQKIEVTEYDINQRFTAILTEKLEAQGFEVASTQTYDCGDKNLRESPGDKDDCFTNRFQDRLSIANREDAVMYMPIHSNISPSSATTGVRTYFHEDSSNEMSKQFAENMALSTDGDAHPHRTSLLNPTAFESSRGNGYTVSEGLGDQNAALIELGFMSNPDELKNLNNDAYLEQLADKVAQGMVATYEQMQTLEPSKYAELSAAEPQVPVELEKTNDILEMKNTASFASIVDSMMSDAGLSADTKLSGNAALPLNIEKSTLVER